MAIGLEVVASNVAAFMGNIAPIISIILIISGGIVWGLAQMQPAEARGKWQMTGLSMVVGGLIVGAIAGAATFIQEQSAGLLKPA